MAQEPWGKEFTDRVGAEVARRRAALDLSAQQVADRTAELGHPVSRSVVSDLGNPRRPSRLAVPDWLVLAAALEMPPLALLFPGAPGAEVEPLPKWEVPAIRAIDWAVGYAAGPPGTSREAGPWAQYMHAASEYLSAAQFLVAMEAELSEAERRGEDQGEIRRLLARVQAHAENVAKARGAGEMLQTLGMPWATPADSESLIVGYYDLGPTSGDDDG